MDKRKNGSPEVSSEEWFAQGKKGTLDQRNIGKKLEDKTSSEWVLPPEKGTAASGASEEKRPAA